MTPTAVGSLTPMAVQATASSGAAVPATALVWESADPTLATVDEGGVVKPLRVGFTTIKVSADGVSASGTVSVRGTTPIPARSRHVGMNLAGIAYYSSQFPFADMMKSGMGWASREDNGTWGKPFPSLTADGYPAALAPGQHALNAVAWDGSRFAPGRYVVLWDGDGSISFPLSNVKVAESAGEPDRDRRRRHERQPLGGDRPHEREQPGAQPSLPLARDRGDVRRASRSTPSSSPRSRRSRCSASWTGARRMSRRSSNGPTARTSPT
jgi:hypothetical protein